ncbi:MAG TPA: hypothetical protein PLC86_23040, partial [Candidatus Accumulibacter phosphatis]|nr:hypothetical protein [Candidatus Accumulibacter phosphatis]
LLARGDTLHCTHQALAEDRAARLAREAREKAAASARRKAERDAAKAAAEGGSRPLSMRIADTTSEAAT